ncbi:hypothetical protein [uncultured Tenacibaculum sp.]|uniref:hypothetical protein n=1 Tax=uncultured Tenacibaculum sp. TaxID=174713 RepID=UPI00261BCBB6|nr:hypothetical protein [uncultured Tenacibaculum sp.]
MKKSILNFGKLLDKTQQQQIKGGNHSFFDLTGGTSTGANPVNNCICNYATGTWNDPHCGSGSCYEIKAPDAPVPA